MILAPAMGIYLSLRLGYFWLFYISGGLAVMAMFLAAQLPVDEKGVNRTEVVSGTMFLEIKALPASLTGLLVALSYSSVITFLQIYANLRGISNVGVFFTVFALTSLLSRPFAGRLYDIHGPAVGVVPGLLLMAVALFLISCAHSIMAFIVAAFVFGLGFGGIHPSLQASAVEGVAPSRRGIAQANFFSALDIGLGAGSMVFGLVAQSLGYAFMYRLAGVTSLGGLGVYWFTTHALKAKK